MASITIIGVIDSIRYLPHNGGCIVCLSEYKRGYKKHNGEVIDDKYMSWKTIWKPYFNNYIEKHFNKGMVVEVKGDAVPYAIEHEKLVEGYSVIGQTLNMFSIPRTSLRQEQKMIKESQLHSAEAPNLTEFQSDDF
jgi:hypothetical protein